MTHSYKCKDRYWQQPIIVTCARWVARWVQLSPTKCANFFLIVVRYASATLIISRLPICKTFLSILKLPVKLKNLPVKLKNYFCCHLHHFVECPKIIFKNSWYIISLYGGSWHGNRVICQSQGGDLISIETEEEWNFINNEIQRRNTMTIDGVLV